MVSLSNHRAVIPQLYTLHFEFPTPSRRPLFTFSTVILHFPLYSLTFPSSQEPAKSSPSNAWRTSILWAAQSSWRPRQSSPPPRVAWTSIRLATSQSRFAPRPSRNKKHEVYFNSPPVLYQNLSLATTTHRKMYRTPLIPPCVSGIVNRWLCLSFLSHYH